MLHRDGNTNKKKSYEELSWKEQQEFLSWHQEIADEENKMWAGLADVLIEVWKTMYGEKSGGILPKQVNQKLRRSCLKKRHTIIIFFSNFVLSWMYFIQIERSTITTTETKTHIREYWKFQPPPAPSLSPSVLYQEENVCIILWI